MPAEVDLSRSIPNPWIVAGSVRELERMKKKQASDDADRLDREFDFSKGRPNPYFVEYHGSKMIRVLAPDLAEVFPDNKSVNDALRKLAEGTPRRKASARRVAAPRTKKSS